MSANETGIWKHATRVLDIPSWKPRNQFILNMVLSVFAVSQGALLWGSDGDHVAIAFLTVFAALYFLMDAAKQYLAWQTKPVVFSCDAPTMGQCLELCTTAIGSGEVSIDVEYRNGSWRGTVRNG